MITMPNALRTIEQLARENSPAILTAFGVTGTVTTAYLTGTAAYESADIIRKEQDQTGEVLSRKEQAALVWRLYVPAGISGAVTVACIVGAAKIGSRRAAALTVAYSLSDRAFHEYREKVIETLGEGKEQKVRDEIAQDRVLASPPGGAIVVGTNNVLCCELYTQRYFECDMETLRKAQNDINAKTIRQGFASLSDFYDMLGIDFTSLSWEMGWADTKLMELEFSAVLTSKGVPCMAFDYSYIQPL